MARRWETDSKVVMRKSPQSHREHRDGTEGWVSVRWPDWKAVCKVVLRRSPQSHREHRDGTERWGSVGMGCTCGAVEGYHRAHREHRDDTERRGSVRWSRGSFGVGWRTGIVEEAYG